MDPTTRWRRAAAPLVITTGSIVALLVMQLAGWRHQPSGERGAIESADGRAHGEPEPPAGDATRAALGGVGPGVTVGPFVVRTVSEPVRGAILIRTKEGAVYEVRIASEERPPPARAGRFGVYYRRMRVGASYPPEDLVAGAQAIAKSIERGLAYAPMPEGIEALPADPDQAL